MIRRILVTSLFMLTGLASALAQGTLTGTVTDASTDEPLPGVNILIMETGQGAATDVDGIYRISNVEPGTYTLRATYIGYEEIGEEVTITEGDQTYDISLNIESYMLSDVVVTALGIRRSERSIGYSAAQIDGERLATTREPNLVNALAGRSAGVQVQSSSGQPGSGSRIIIRGVSSMIGNNQPLFVVDGVPISNASDENVGESSMLFSGGTANRGVDLDARNIADVSVLKGASATALYGSRAANGAVIITTKSGQNHQAPTVTFYSSTGWADAYTDGYQLDYLGGSEGYSYNMLPEERGGYVEPGAPSENPQTTQSCGPHRNEVSQQVLDDLGVSEMPVCNPRKDFYQTGMTYDNALSLAGGTGSSTYYFSAGHTNQSGIVPESGLERTNLKARFNSQLGDWFQVESSVNYINSQYIWFAEGNGAQAYNFSLAFTPINFDITQTTFEDGTQRMNTPSFNNPLWITDNNPYTSDVDRFIANTSLTYDLLDWLTLSERIGIDTYTDNRKGRTNVGTRGTPTGRMYDQVIGRTEINSDLTLGAVRSLTEVISLDLLVGNNISVRDYSSEETFGTNLSVPDFFHISNATSITANQDIEQRRLLSLYGQATIDYLDIIYLTLTARNDWSSTLPTDNNSYFYPSASLGFVFTDAFDLFRGSPLSFGKLRASIAQIGTDAPVYSLTTNFTQSDPEDGVRGVINFPFAGTNAYRFRTILGNPELKPEISTEYELGLDLRFFEGRGRFDISYYDRSTVDQIFEVPTSYATGFASRVTNAGEIRNYGVEVTLGLTPIQTTEFRWDVDMNYANNTTDVVEFAPGVENIFLGGFTSPQIRIEDSKNGYGVIWGTRYDRNDEGQLLIDDDGLPVMAPTLGPIGYVQPDWTANLFTSFNFRGWTLSALLDTRQGGEILNMDMFYSSFYGTHEVTADRGRPYVFEGVNATTGEPNDVEIIRDQDFYQGHFSNIDENFVEDGSFVKLRELSLSYALPQSLIDTLPIRGASLTATGRNLWISSDFSYRDPEGNLLGTGNAQGFYHAVTPATRNYTLSLNISF